MTILELLRINKPTADNARQTVETLEDKSAAASAWQLQCQTELDAALLGQAEGLADGAAVQKARKAFEQARQAANDAEAALRGARQRLSDAGAAERDSETAKRWAKVAELSKRRLGHAQLIETQLAGLGEQVKTLLELSAQIHETAPGESDLHASLLLTGDLRAAIRERLWLHGVDTGGPFSEWELLRRPNLAERIEAGNHAMEKTQ